MLRLMLPAVALVSLTFTFAIAHAESFVTATGALVKEGTAWKEVPTGATFKETDRNENVIELYDASRGMYLYLPLEGGMIVWSDANHPGRNELAEGRYVR